MLVYISHIHEFLISTIFMKPSLFLPQSILEKRIPKSIRSFVESYAKYNLFFVGGIVREMLREYYNRDYRDNTDIDCAIQLPISDFKDVLAQDNIQFIDVNIAYGTLVVVLNKNHTLEITALRSDIECEGRQAYTLYSDSFEEDAKRRDFSCNALYCDATGGVYDLVSGVEAIKNDAVIFVGQSSDRIQEDFLRMLRYIRFVTYYANTNFEYIDIFQTYASSLDLLSGERILQEMRKILLSNRLYDVIEFLHNTNMFEYILGVSLNISLINKCHFINILNFEKNLIPNSQHLYLLHIAYILHLTVDINKAREFVRTRWKLSNKDAKYLRMLCDNILNLENENIRLDLARLAYYHSKEDVLHILILSYFIEPKLDILKHQEELENIDVKPIPVNGHDLIGKVTAGQIGKILLYLTHCWIESYFTLSKAKLLEFITQYFDEDDGEK